MQAKDQHQGTTGTARANGRTARPTGSLGSHSFASRQSPRAMSSCQPRQLGFPCENFKKGNEGCRRAFAQDHSDPVLAGSGWGRAPPRGGVRLGREGREKGQGAPGEARPGDGEWKGKAAGRSPGRGGQQPRQRWNLWTSRIEAVAAETHHLSRLVGLFQGSKRH